MIDNLNTIFLLVSLVTLGIGVLFGMWRSLYATIWRFVTLILSAVGAYFLAKGVLVGMGDSLVEALRSLTNGAFDTYLNDPELTQLGESLAVMLFAPIFFLVFYYVFKLLSWIPYKIIAVVLHLKGPAHVGRLLGAVAGAVCGFVTLVVIVTPVFGYAELALTAVHLADEEGELTQMVEPFESVLETPVAAQGYAMFGKTLFTALTTTEWEDTEINLKHETDVIVEVVKDEMPLLDKPMGEYSVEESQAIEKLADDLSESPVLCVLISSVLSDTSKAWLQGETALGVSKPEAGEVQDILDSLLLVFASSERTNIGTDLHTFADVLRIMIENELFSLVGEEGGGDVLVEKLASGGVAGQLYQVLDSNPRMKTVKASIANTGVRMMMKELGDADQLREEHGEMLESMTAALKEHRNEDGTLNKESLNAEIQQVVTDYEIPVSEDVTQLVVDSVADAFTAEELDTMTTDEMVDRLIEHFTAADSPIELPEDLLDQIPEELPEDLPGNLGDLLP